MTWKLTALISHKSFDEPVTKEVYYQGDCLDDVLAKIENDAKTPKHFIHNLKHHGRCAFKDIKGVKHSWRIELMEHLN
jgi:hypothetical protein